MLSKTLTIFEGVDGAGKTTAAKEYADEIKARYVHFPALKEVRISLPRLYVEAMLPALLGYQDVVFDRSWYSEPIYGEVFRAGANRVGTASCLMLERLAMRCGGVVVNCDPGWDAIRRSYEARQKEEMLTSLALVGQAYQAYQRQVSSIQLPIFQFDYTVGDAYWRTWEDDRMSRHPAHRGTAGNLSARIVLVGDGLAERKETDAWYQWPFASFSAQGCSRWLTEQLFNHGINERDLLWLNSSDADLLTKIESMTNSTIVALGREAEAALLKQGLAATFVEHPQAWKRFHANETYPLIKLLRSLL